MSYLPKSFINKYLTKLIGERNPYTSPNKLKQAGKYIASVLQNFNYKTYAQKVPFDGTESDNILAVKPGYHEAIFIVGAHYDTVQGTPGADDNASAVAALLEIAKNLQNVPLKSSVVFCGFTLEEYGLIGSKAYVEKLISEKTVVSGMISLEMVGYRNRQPGSQTYPPYVDPSKYPDTGDFIAVVGNEPSQELAISIASKMKEHVPELPVEYLILPGKGDQFKEVLLSDHSPFWDKDYRAVMITDTAFFRNPHYHQPTDKIETLDLEFIQNVAEGISGFLQKHLG